MASIEVRDLKKTYGDVVALDGVTFEVEPGEVVGFLGPNGAGKTTTIGTLTGLVRPSGGTVQVFGHDAWRDPAAARKEVGLCPQEPNFDDFLGLERILAYHAGYFGLPYGRSLERARELLRFFDLYDYRTKRTSTLSGGMKRRLLLARAIMHEPRLLILDEPTAGVDVELRRGLWEYVTRLNQEEGITVLLTTHYLEEAEALCDDVTVIDQGKVIERGSPDALRHKYGSQTVRVESRTRVRAADLGFTRADGAYVCEGADSTQHLAKLLARIDAAGGTVEDVDVSRSRLEDVFVRLTSRGPDRIQGGA